MRFKKAQEEMVGFAVIIIIVAIVLLVFLSFSLKKDKADLENEEVASFLNALSLYTTDCQNDIEFLQVVDLIKACRNQEECLDGRQACAALNQNIEEILDESWKVGPALPTRGYIMNITFGSEEILNIQKGNLTGNYKANTLQFSSRGENIFLEFKVHY